MPTSAVRTWSNTKVEPYSNPQDARQRHVLFGASLDLAQGTVVGRKTADGKYYAYANGNADGTETAVGILPYAINTDASGNVTLADDVSTGDEHGVELVGVPIWVAGEFLYDDLVGLDANGLADMQGRVVAGPQVLGAGSVVRIG